MGQTTSAAIGLLARAPLATMLIDRDGVIGWHNDAASELLDSEGDLVGRPLVDMMAPLERAAIAATITDAADGDTTTSRRQSVTVVVDGLPSALELHVQRADDTTLVAQLVAAADESSGATPEEQHAFRTALLELSELSHEHDDEREFYREFIRRAVDVVPGAQGGSILLRRSGTDEFHFVAAEGFDLAALQERHLLVHEMFRDVEQPSATINRDLVSPEVDPAKRRWLREAGRIHEIVTNVSAPVLTDGEAVAFVSLDNFDDRSAFTSSSVEMTTVLGRLVADLITRRALEAELRRERESFKHLALHDGLTGLANRRHLEAALAEAVGASNRTGRSLSLLFVDVDDFKVINDELGHDVGDRVLTAVADALRLATRTVDVVGRWGGDEFLVVAPRLARRSHAIELGQRILEMFGSGVTLDDGRCVPCSLSVGVAWSRNAAEGAHTLLRRADDALYDAKVGGKDTVRAASA
ncbi:MAG: GGDEF domain-containing protein [Actinomycetota bacterium]